MSRRREADAIAEMQDRGQSKSRRAAGVALVVAGALVLTTAGSMALAQDQRQGSGPAAAASPGTGTQSGGGSDGADGLQSNLGELPFTGLDLLILGGLAMVLLGTGMALRRLSAPRV